MTWLIETFLREHNVLHDRLDATNRATSRTLDDAIAALLAENARLTRRCEDAERDAARYRWISNPVNVEEAEPILKMWGNAMTAAIDAALTSAGKGERT